jgi:hypothetical protein
MPKPKHNPWTQELDSSFDYFSAPPIPAKRKVERYLPKRNRPKAGDHEQQDQQHEHTQSCETRPREARRHRIW